MKTKFLFILSTVFLFFPMKAQASIWGSFVQWLSPASVNKINELEIIQVQNVFSEGQLNRIEKSLQEEFLFSTNVRAGSLPLEAAYNEERDQYDTEVILGLPEIGLSGPQKLRVYIMQGDLYTEGMNFLFAKHDIKKNAVILSMNRFLLPNPEVNENVQELIYHRFYKILKRRIGVAAGLRDSTNSCVMTFSINLMELDQQESEYCPDDAERLREVGILR